MCRFPNIIYLSTCIIFKTITFLLFINDIPNFSYDTTCLDDACCKYQVTGIFRYIKIFTIGRTHFFAYQKLQNQCHERKKHTGSTNLSKNTMEAKYLKMCKLKSFWFLSRLNFLYNSFLMISTPIFLNPNTHYT